MKIIEYFNTETLEVIETNMQMTDSKFKKWRWIDDNGQVQNHPLRSVESKYWDPVVDDYPTEKTQVDKDAVDQAEADAEAQRLLDNKDFTLSAGKINKAMGLSFLDTINNIRSWLADFKSEVANATDLDDLKTRVASLPDMPSFSVKQLKTVIANKYDTL